MIRLLMLALSCFVSASAWGNDRLLQQAWTDLQQLAADDMAGRFPGTVGHARAQEYIVKRFTELGLLADELEFRQRFSFGVGDSKTGVNLAARLQGCRYPNQWIVVSAHYDHLAARGRHIYNGADDNASGVAGLLYLAAKLKQQPCPAYSYIFLATDAEEEGLLGAKAWLAAQAPTRQIVLNVNLDMISRGEKQQRLYMVGWKSLPVEQALPVQQQGQVRLMVREGRSLHRRNQPRIDWRNASDHAVFRKAGLPYLYFGVDVHPHYHTPEDDWQRVQPEFFYSALQLISETLLWLDQQSLGQMGSDIRK